jgi:hypothetical protein
MNIRSAMGCQKHADCLRCFLLGRKLSLLPFIDCEKVTSNLICSRSLFIGLTALPDMDITNYTSFSSFERVNKLLLKYFLFR